MLHVAYIIATSGMVTFHFISGKMVHMTVLGDSLFYITAFFIGGKETGIFYIRLWTQLFPRERKGVTFKV